MAVTLKIKRAYLAPAKSDGCRVLVERLWPRGLNKKKAAVDRLAAPAAGSQRCALADQRAVPGYLD